MYNTLMTTDVIVMGGKIGSDELKLHGFDCASPSDDVTSLTTRSCRNALIVGDYTANSQLHEWAR
jgi:hypothetical protein